MLFRSMSFGHYSLPKGHIEKGENDIECALREIKEETNLRVYLIPGFIKKTTYYSAVNTLKDVYFYLFRCDDITAMKPQLIEVKDILILSFEKAYEYLTYDSDKRVLLDANVFLQDRYL